jgi:(p)ppGpp synthase/HD superfamily hydrolase
MSFKHLNKRTQQSDLILAARTFAEKAHGEQKRKYLGTPYVDHCFEVANLVASVGGTDVMICAALLHDTLEDTETVRGDFVTCFGDVGILIGDLVVELTDVSTPEDGNRKARKAKDLEHLSRATPTAQTIKLADTISNSLNIIALDPAFSKVYIPEMKQRFPHLQQGDPRLLDLATRQVEAGEMYMALLEGP